MTLKSNNSLYNFQISGINVQAHPSGGLFFIDAKILVLADLHLGKIAHFRKYGSAITAEAADSDFDKLSRIVDDCQPKKLLFLGDLFHSEYNRSFLKFKEWRLQHPELDIELILGNHDIMSHALFEELNIQVVEEYIMAGIRLSHHPEENVGIFNICGHLHPGFILKGSGGQKVRMRCFYWKKNQLILPAFGNFTGQYIVKPKQGERVLIITETSIFPLTK